MNVPKHINEYRLHFAGIFQQFYFSLPFSTINYIRKILQSQNFEIEIDLYRNFFAIMPFDTAKAF